MWWFEATLQLLSSASLIHRRRRWWRQRGTKCLSDAVISVNQLSIKTNLHLSSLSIRFSLEHGIFIRSSTWSQLTNWWRIGIRWLQLFDHMSQNSLTRFHRYQSIWVYYWGGELMDWSFMLVVLWLLLLSINLRWSWSRSELSADSSPEKGEIEEEGGGNWMILCCSVLWDSFVKWCGIISEDPGIPPLLPPPLNNCQGFSRLLRILNSIPRRNSSVTQSNHFRRTSAVHQSGHAEWMSLLNFESINVQRHWFQVNSIEW